MRHAVPREPGDAWMNYVIHKPALLNTALVLAASHLMLLGGSQPDLNSVYFYHKAEAIRIINNYLADPSFINDDTIAGVALLTVVEVSTS